MDAEKWTFNAHEARFEPPDIMWLSFRGKTEVEDVRWAAGLFRQIAAKAPVFVASDVRDSTISAEARSCLAHEAKAEWFRAAIYIGSGLPQKAMAKAINVALLLLGKPLVEIVFVDDAGQAREWIERARAQSRRKAGSAGAQG